MDYGLEDYSNEDDLTLFIVSIDLISHEKQEIKI